MTEEDRKAKYTTKRQRRNTAILAGGLAAAFLILYGVQRMMLPDSGLVAVIQMDGEKIRGMDLDEDAEYRVQTEDGHYNVVVVQDQSVMVREADCENQVCVMTGRIRYPGEVIACLPHRLIIYIED